jgi:hypothetical protein
MRRVRQLTDRHARPLVANDEVGGRSRPPPVPGHGVQGRGLAAGDADDAEAATGCCEGGGRRTETERWPGARSAVETWAEGPRVVDQRESSVRRVGRSIGTRVGLRVVVGYVVGRGSRRSLAAGARLEVGRAKRIEERTEPGDFLVDCLVVGRLGHKRARLVEHRRAHEQGGVDAHGQGDRVGGSAVESALTRRTAHGHLGEERAVAQLGHLDPIDVDVERFHERGHQVVGEGSGQRRLVMQPQRDRNCLVGAYEDRQNPARCIVLAQQHHRRTTPCLDRDTHQVDVLHRFAPYRRRHHRAQRPDGKNSPTPSGTIPIDEYQDDDTLVVRVELAGIDPEADVEPTVTTAGCTRNGGILDIRIPTAAVEAPEKIPNRQDLTGACKRLRPASMSEAERLPRRQCRRQAGCVAFVATLSGATRLTVTDHRALTVRRSRRQRPLRSASARRKVCVMEIDESAVFSADDQAELRDVLGLQDDDLEAALQRIALAALAEYREMLLEGGAPSRADEVLEHRLYFLTKHYFGDRIPSEPEVSRAFHETLSKSAERSSVTY